MDTKDAVTGQCDFLEDGMTRANPLPSLGKFIEVRSPIEDVPSWPHAVGEDRGINPNSNVFIPSKRSKNDPPDLINGDHLHDEVPYGASEYIHLPADEGGESSTVVDSSYTNVPAMMLDAADPNVDVTGDAAVRLERGVPDLLCRWMS